MATVVKNWTTGTGSATIEYGGQGDGQITVTTDANNLYEARSMQVTVRTTDGSKSVLLDIVQAARQRTDLSNAIVTASNQTYNGSAKTPTPTVTLNGSTVPSTGYDVSYSNNTNAGTATITITGKGDYTGTAYGTFTINKATPTYTAPTYNDWTYDGSSHYLVTTGSTNHGTIQFSTDGSSWSTTRPTQTNAGVYYTYWRLVGDSNHTDISPASIRTDVSKATPSYTAPATRSLTYNGSSQYLTTSGSTSHGTIYYSTDGSNWYTSRRTGTNAGTYYCYWKLVGDSNHTDISSTYLGLTTIAKASRSIYWSTYPSTLEVGDSSSLYAYASAGDGSVSYYSYSSSIASVSGSTVTANSVGSCTIEACVEETSNYLSASDTITVNTWEWVDASWSFSAYGQHSSTEGQQSVDIKPGAEIVCSISSDVRPEYVELFGCYGYYSGGADLLSESKSGFTVTASHNITEVGFYIYRAFAQEGWGTCTYNIDFKYQRFE